MRTGSKKLEKPVPCVNTRWRKTDQIDAYIERFERFVKVQLWKPEVWATNLSTLLTGKALDVYSRILAADALDYN